MRYVKYMTLEVLLWRVVGQGMCSLNILDCSNQISNPTSFPWLLILYVCFYTSG